MIALALVVLTVSACSAAEADPSPYRAEFDDAISRATNDFEREVLSDYSVTKAEYDEAVAMVVECAAAQGVRVGVEEVPGSGNRYSVAASGENVYDSCSQPLASVELLYTSQLQNPDNRPFEELVVECLRVRGVVPAEFGVEELMKDQASGGATTDFENPDVETCLTTPQLR